MVLKLSEKVHFFFQFFADLSKKFKPMKEVNEVYYTNMKGLVRHFQKMLLFIMLRRTVLEITEFEVDEFC